MNRETLLTPEQLAEHLQVTVRRLSHWRGRGEGPRFLKMPWRPCAAALREFVEAEQKPAAPIDKKEE